MLNIFLISLCCLMVPVGAWAQPKLDNGLEQRVYDLEQNQIMMETMQLIKENQRKQQQLPDLTPKGDTEPYYPKPYTVPQPIPPTEQSK